MRLPVGMLEFCLVVFVFLRRSLGRKLKGGGGAASLRAL